MIVSQFFESTQNKFTTKITCIARDEAEDEALEIIAEARVQVIFHKLSMTGAFVWVVVEDTGKYSIESDDFEQRLQVYYFKGIEKNI